MSNDKTYTVRLKGKNHSFAVEGWDGLTLHQAATVLSDVTGYRVPYLVHKIMTQMDFNAAKITEVVTADNHLGKSTPCFIVQEST